MRVLVTGGAGFIGSHVVDRLVAAGRQVVVLDNLDPQVHGPDAEPTHIQGHIDSGAVDFIQGDIRDRDAVRKSLEDVDRVVHLAAAVGVGQSMYEPHYYTSVNVDGQGVLMEAMVEGAARYERFVVASSMSIYGEGRYRCAEHGEMAPLPRPTERLERAEWEVPCPECGRDLELALTDESKPLQYSSIYAITKKTQEELALCFGVTYDIPTFALRFFNVYGSRQALSNPYTGVAAIFMSRLKNGKPPLLFEDGNQSRDFIHVHDIADAIIRALDVDDAAPGAYNVGTGTPRSIKDVAETLARRMGVDIAPEIVGKYRSGDIRHCICDPTATKEQLGFEARLSFEEGLDELLEWSEEQEAADRVDASFEELDEAGIGAVKVSRLWVVGATLSARRAQRLRTGFAVGLTSSGLHDPGFGQLLPGNRYRSSADRAAPLR